MGRQKILLLSALVLGAATYADAQSIISASRRIDWSAAGVVGGIPTRTTNCATLNPGATAAQINSAIAACPAGQVVLLNAGTYNLSAGITFGGRNNITLRGAGPHLTFLKFSGVDGCAGLGGAAICVFNGDSNSGDAGNWRNYANWTAGYASGTTSITLDAVPNLQVGSVLILDQCNDGLSGQPSSASNSGCGAGSNADNGNLWICQTVNVCSQQGATYLSRAPGNRNQIQLVRVTSISGTGPFTVGITPGLYMPNWRASQSPGAWWSSRLPISMDGIENLSVDSSNASPGGVFFFFNAYNCWMKNVRSINANAKHVWTWQAAHLTIRDSYFYGTQAAASDSYGTDNLMSADNLIENNLFQHVATPLQNENSVGIVQSYNYSLDDYYTKGGTTQWQQGSSYHHGAGDLYHLFEGNQGVALTGDNIHGTADFITAFRNYFNGRDPTGGSIGGKTQQTNPVQLEAFNRYYNFIGNVLGTAGYHTNYQVAPSSATDAGSAAASNSSIYSFGFSGNEGTHGCCNNDTILVSTTMRWGNYDTVNNGVRWVAAEVPSGLSLYANPVPGNQILPASLYLTSAPPFWGTPWGTPPWPAIGPDVSGGNLPNVAGHASNLPAALCYANSPIDANYPGAAGRGVLLFNATSCYAGGVGPANPTNLRIVR
jgi:hypothetical protein